MTGVSLHQPGCVSVRGQAPSAPAGTQAPSAPAWTRAPSAPAIGAPPGHAEVAEAGLSGRAVRSPRPASDDGPSPP